MLSRYTLSVLSRRYRSYRCSFSPFSSSSSSSSSPENASTVVQGPSLLIQTGLPRPSPSLLLLPGLRSLPFWTSPNHKVAYNDPTVRRAIELLESNYEDIRREYLKTVMGVSSPTLSLPKGSSKYEDNESMKLEDKNNNDDHDTNDPTPNIPLASDYDVTTKGGEHASDALHTGGWDWHSYLLQGKVQDPFPKRFPKTFAVLEKLRQESILFVNTPFSFCFFSTLHPNSRIKAHVGPMNLRLRLHFPLIVPSTAADTAEGSSGKPSCGIRVADKVQRWQLGKAMVLDDSYSHEVWNDTDEPRVLLLVDLWHPDIALEERDRIEAMFDHARSEGWIGGER